MAVSATNFVLAIEQYPCLYNNKLPEYSKKDVTDKAWMEVSQKTNLSVADCQTKWRNIRNGFVRSLKPTPSGSSAKQKKLYYLHEELQFVLPFVKAIVHTNEPGNIPRPPPPEENANNDTNSTIDEEPCIQTATNTLKTPSSESDASHTFKKPKIRKATNEADKAFIDWIKKKETKTDDARKMFLLSLLPDVQNLTEEQMRKFRIKVLLLLEEIQSQVPQQQQPQVPQQQQPQVPQQQQPQVLQQQQPQVPQQQQPQVLQQQQPQVPQQQQPQVPQQQQPQVLQQQQPQVPQQQQPQVPQQQQPQVPQQQQPQVLQQQQPQVPQQYEENYYQQSPQYRNTYSPISSVISISNSSLPPLSPLNYSVNANYSDDLSQLENFEDL